MLMCRQCFKFGTIMEQEKRCRKCKSKSYIVDIDDGMVEPLKALWEVGIFTDNCCGGHINHPRFYAYVLFSPNLYFADWLSRNKFKIGKKFKPVDIGVGDRGFTQIHIKEPHKGAFADKTKERHIETFSSCLFYIAEQYKKDTQNANGTEVQRSLPAFRNGVDPF